MRFAVDFEGGARGSPQPMTSAALSNAETQRQRVIDEVLDIAVESVRAACGGSTRAPLRVAVKLWENAIWRLVILALRGGRPSSRKRARRRSFPCHRRFRFPPAPT